MRFAQLDRITDVQIGESLRAVKGLTLSEEYLQDHFPRFPVMPGVLMMEAMFQASMWLVRATEDFAHARVVLRQSRNIKFQDLVEPGRQLEIDVQLKSMEGPEASVAVKGAIDGKRAVGGRLQLERYNLADRGEGAAEIDQHMRNEFRRKFHLLCGPNCRINEAGQLAKI